MSHAFAVNDANFDQEVLKSPTPVLVDFWAAWCGPCKALAPAIDQIATELVDKLKVVKVDVDENMEVSGRYGVLSIPTMALFKNGEIVEKMVGAYPKGAIVSKILPHL
jgi:thioredoxin 1